ncbi:MAG: MerR family transcriptional regulator [Alphaproteobacteria bacterium]|nr:MerR family transcriptional regulator [Alphaproteobacteria bacterium]
MQDTASAPASSALLAHEVKSPNAFRTISEVADDLSLPQHVLRFWESKFQQIKPLKRGGGRRYYRPEDVKIIHDIKELLYNQGFTIRGVQKLLRESGSAASLARSMVPAPQVPTTVPTASTAQPAQQQQHQPVIQPQQPQGMSSDKRREIEGVLSELRSMRKILQQSGI